MAPCIFIFSYIILKVIQCFTYHLRVLTWTWMDFPFSFSLWCGRKGKKILKWFGKNSKNSHEQNSSLPVKWSPGKKLSTISISMMGYWLDGSISRVSEKSLQVPYSKFSRVLKLITFLGGSDAFLPSIDTGLATPALLDSLVGLQGLVTNTI